MRITAIRLERLALPLDPPFYAAWDPVPRPSFEATIVRVETDAGLTGIGCGDTMSGFDDFVSVFSNLEWDKFTTFFAEDATAFFPPSAKYPYRANNKTEIEKVFKAFFDTIKAQKANPPYLTIKPIDLKIQIFSSTAVVTFMLDDLNLLGRRTFILEKQNGKWLIVHLHASGVATTD